MMMMVMMIITCLLINFNDFISKQIRLKKKLFNKTRQYNIHIISFKYRTRQIKATETNK